MLLLTATTDKLQLVTGSAATLDVHASFMDSSNADPPVVKGSTSGRQHTAITTATTTDIVAAPAASTLRNVKTIHVRNKHATTSTDVTVLFDQNGTDFELWKANLAPGEALEYVEGIGWFEAAAAFVSGTSTNRSTAAQGAGFATDTYVTGSSVPLAGLGTPVIGTTYRVRLDIAKTAAGTAAPIIQVRVGTAGTTADASRVTFTFGAGTAAADTAFIELNCMFRAVGASAVLQGQIAATTNLASTGWSSTIKALQVTSAAFDSTVANSIIGLSYNGGTSAAHTIQLVRADLQNF